MQQAIPYKPWPPLHSPTSSAAAHRPPSPPTAQTDVLDMVSENAVIVIARKGCCMSHVVRRLLLALGVNPAVYEVGVEEEAGALSRLEMTCKGDGGDDATKVQFPVVFIGGKLFGGLDKIMATHISGELVPVLKQAGALWL
ncbi:hypothetical protein SLEP1_g9584 [Rubroshorea leprosula]|uniref:Glutaredoxin domain-containing protein n=1 Tax=Rubroshorea leprosula TaxID=152421 RepID=A0AAV5IBA8_9ROSI|nr:hypothetical protein SLEP1_g9584 [Rubroshorea leprosula]